MTDLEIAQQKLAEAEAKLRGKEYDWFVLRFVLAPSAIGLVASVIALSIALIKNTA